MNTKKKRILASFSDIEASDITTVIDDSDEIDMVDINRSSVPLLKSVSLKYQGIEVSYTTLNNPEDFILTLLKQLKEDCHDSSK